ncbi:solute carrier family 35 member G1-like [Apostichopus japonicus]|uniref:solute carrier family 35 member G1-like n=1 Tax=Stichopus japonicus TaxID=307972 RepID=UPI003AB537A6
MAWGTSLANFGQTCYARRGLIFVFMSAFLAGLMDLCMKVVLPRLHPIEVTAVRCTVMFLCIIPDTVYNSELSCFASELRKEYRLIVIRSLFATAGSTLIICAINYTEIGDAVSVYHTMPVFAGILSTLLLREKYTVVQFGLSILSFTGVILVSRPPLIHFLKDYGISQSVRHLYGTILALSCAIVTAASFVLSRKLSSRNISANTILFYFGFVSTVTTIPLVSICREWKVPECGSDRMTLIMSGILNFLVQKTLIAALELEKAVYVTVMFTLNIVFVFLIQFLFLGVPFDLFSVCGAVIIILASVGIMFEKNRETTEEQSPSLQQHQQQQQQEEQWEMSSPYERQKLLP